MKTRSSGRHIEKSSGSGRISWHGEGGTVKRSPDPAGTKFGRGEPSNAKKNGHTRSSCQQQRLTHLFGIGVLLAGLVPGTMGCSVKPKTPVVIFLDGAGHFGYAGPVRRGLRAAGYDGRFEQFVWTSLLGPGVDHLVVARQGRRAGSLAKKIERIRKADPEGPIHLIGLSAGSAIVVSALEKLDRDAAVDNVVLLSPSISANRNLSRALRNVRGHVYCTASKDDGILKVLAVNADGGSGPPAGETGLRMPQGLSQAQRERYRRVVNLPWQPAYAGYGWDGGHTSVTSSEFIEKVIAPRLQSNERFPTDRPLFRGGVHGDWRE